MSTSTAPKSRFKLKTSRFRAQSRATTRTVNSRGIPTLRLPQRGTPNTDSKFHKANQGHCKAPRSTNCRAPDDNHILNPLSSGNED
ncbi:hypothetical protein BaRGS_00018078 [Batillaria attramentaria]|uniref:Uncharacterized protein n=1 Tax=Batillaria attramentaria TaxID=370345 RepID=A0ABD0KTQ9_9CAEN